MYKAIPLLLLACLSTIWHAPNLSSKFNITASGEHVRTDTPKIQVVFALDATGSMSGLIAAAKEKIWAIASSLSQAEPAPDIEMGLIFYRDRGDEFITRQVPLTKDLDEAYEQLMRITADGGGDSPESVNQGLHEAVTKFAWDSSATTYKTIFLVGDCPPHMDYKTDVKYPESCKRARQKDIVLNTILMGNDPIAYRIWNEIANCNQGSFIQVNMQANDIIVETPYDSVIAKVSDNLDGTRYYYGNESIKYKSEKKKEKSAYVAANTTASAKVQRAEYLNISKSGSTAYYENNNDLLADVKNRKINLEQLKEEELPEELKKLSPEQRAAFVQQKIHMRDSLQAVLNTLVQKRNTYINAELDKKDTSAVNNSFNTVIYENMKKQTKKKNITLKGKAKF